MSDNALSTLAESRMVSGHVTRVGKSQGDSTGQDAGGGQQSDPEKAFQPIKARQKKPEGAGPGQASTSRSNSLYTTRSYGDGHGYTCFGHDEEHQASNPGQAEDPEKQFEVQWDGGSDPMNPRSRSKARKWLVVILVSMSSLCVYVLIYLLICSMPMLKQQRTCTSSLYTSTYEQITREFHCSQEVATLGLSVFVMGLGIGPMVVAPLSEVDIPSGS